MRESSSDAAMEDAIRKMMEVTTGSRIRGVVIPAHAGIQP
jgi:hypothetical protein